MTDARRLIEAAAGFHHHSADAFVFEQHPALEDIDELHVGGVIVPFAVRRLAGPRANDMGDDLASGRALDAEIAILEVVAQAAALEFFVFAMRDVEAGHGAIILGYDGSPMFEQFIGTK